MNSPQQHSKKGTWSQALKAFWAPILGVLVVRWLLVEPFVIPSGSMIPTLLTHDHIVVNKLAYGIHFPLGTKWILQWSSPTRRDIAVFKYPKNPDVYYIKRIVAVAGDEIEVVDGKIILNGQEIEQIPLSDEKSKHLEALKYSGEEDENSFSYYHELGAVVRYHYGVSAKASFEKTVVPEKSFFVMGDNRDQSSDSRVWGFVPEEYLVGRAYLIWLSCDKTLQDAPFLCDPRSMRWGRMFHRTQ